MKYQIKQLGLGGILDQSISIVRDNFGLLFGIVGVSIVPIALIVGFVQHFALTNGNGIAAGITMLVAVILSIPLSVLANIAVMYAVASVYLSRPTTIGQCFSHALRRFWPVLGTAFLYGLAVFGGFILLIIPGIIAAFWFTLSQEVAVLESNAGLPALKRSRALMKGNIGTAFALGLILGIINLFIAFGAGIIPQEHLRIIASAFVQGITVLLASSGMVVFYFSCRCKLENFDLHLLAQAVGTEDGEQFTDGIQTATAD